MPSDSKSTASDGAFRLLVVDDESITRSTLTRLLRATCDIEAVGTIDEAASVLQNGNISGVITDLVLPDGDGFAVIEEARRDNPGLPSLLITGYLDPDIAAKAFAMGITFLPKPVAPENILAFARRCMLYRSNGVSRIEALGDDWQLRYQLTPTERDVLVAIARGVTREELLETRRIAETTLKRHVTNLLEKTHEASLDRAALRFLREVLRDLE